jgi:hypothetical protein
MDTTNINGLLEIILESTQESDEDNVNNETIENNNSDEGNNNSDEGNNNINIQGSMEIININNNDNEVYPDIDSENRIPSPQQLELPPPPINGIPISGDTIFFHHGGIHYIINRQDVMGGSGILERTMNNSFNEQTNQKKPLQKSFLDNLEKITIMDETQALSCAICQSPLEINEKALKLPCQGGPHYFHCEMCEEKCMGILPWFSENNTCPVCREEFPIEPEPENDGTLHEPAIAESESEQDSEPESENDRALDELPMNIISQVGSSRGLPPLQSPLHLMRHIMMRRIQAEREEQFLQQAIMESFSME